MSSTIDRKAMIDAILSDRIPAPAKRWKNMVLVLKRQLFKSDTGDLATFNGGDRVRLRHVYPSKEIAEQKFNEFYSEHYAGKNDGVIEYLGAFPE